MDRVVQEGIAKFRKSKKIIYKQEEHYDDCGSDMEPLEETTYLNHLSADKGNIDSLVGRPFFDALNDNSEQHLLLDFHQERIVEDGLEESYWNGSDSSNICQLPDVTSEPTVHSPKAYHVKLGNLMHS